MEAVIVYALKIQISITTHAYPATSKIAFYVYNQMFAQHANRTIMGYLQQLAFSVISQTVSHAQAQIIVHHAQIIYK